MITEVDIKNDRNASIKGAAVSDLRAWWVGKSCLWLQFKASLKNQMEREIIEKVGLE